jgi:hypothetical protein
MAKFSRDSISDDETRMKPYADLSRGAKQEQDLQRRGQLATAQRRASAGDSVGQRVSDSVSGALLASPLNKAASRDLAELRNQKDERESQRQGELRRAQSAADYKDVESGATYSDMAPGPIRRAGTTGEWGGKWQK